MRKIQHGKTESAKAKGNSKALKRARRQHKIPANQFAGHKKK